MSLQGIDDCRLAYLDLNSIKVLEMPEVIDRPQAVSNFSEAHQRMATKIIQFLNEKVDAQNLAKFRIILRMRHLNPSKLSQSHQDQ